MISRAKRLARQHGLEHDLQLQEARQALLTARVDQAKARVAAATAALEEAEARRLQAEEECASIRHLLSFDPDVVHSLPVELLTMIWSEVLLLSPPQDSDSFEDPHTNPDSRFLHLRTPCRLAAVCRHWRYVALNTPRLWTHLALRPGITRTTSPGIHDAMLDLVRLHMARSRSLALELDLLQIYSLPKLRSDALPVVAPEAHRWRSLKLRVSPKDRDLALLDQLLCGRQLPLLEELQIIGDSVDTIDAQWMSGAVRLKVLSIHGLMFRPPPMLQLSAVVYAHVDVYANDLEHLWSALSALPSLRSLSLFNTNIRPNTITPSTTRRTLPLLECLKLRGRQQDSFLALASVLVPGLSAPRLSKLIMWAEAVGQGAEWGEAFFAAFPTIVDVEFVGTGRQIWSMACTSGLRFTPGHMEALGCLRRLESVSFTGCRFPAGLFSALDQYGDSPTPPAKLATDACRDWICRPPSYLWPALERVQNLQIRWVPEPWSTRDQMLGELLQFVRSRAAFCATRGKQFTFALLDFPAGPQPNVMSIPSWFRAAVGCLLGQAHVRLTTGDGAVHAPVPEGGEEESEAQSTDSDEENSGHSSSASSEGASDEGGDEWWVVESDDIQSESGSNYVP